MLCFVPRFFFPFQDWFSELNSSRFPFNPVNFSSYTSLCILWCWAMNLLPQLQKLPTDIWKSRTQGLNHSCFLSLELLLHTLTISSYKQNVVTATVKECKTTNVKLCCQNREENYFFKPEVGTIPGFSPHLSLCSPHSQVINYQKRRRGIKCKIMQVEIKMYEPSTPRWIHLLGDLEVYSSGFCISG